MDAADIRLRNITYRRFVELGRAPTVPEIAALTSDTEENVRSGWARLHDAHAIVLDGSGEIAMANPFAAKPTPYRVHAGARSWYANCAWDAFGIGAAMGVDSAIHTVCPDCGETIDLDVRDGRPSPSDLVFHVLVPARSWWDDIGYT